MATFSEPHGGSSPLVLPNAWDVPSALAFVDAGFAAVGTTSLGVATPCPELQDRLARYGRR